MLQTIPIGRWKTLEPLLDKALELAPDERPAYLDTACSGDPQLRAELEQLLDSCERAEHLLGKPAPEVCSALFATPPPAGPGPDDRIGPYRIVGEAGRGGMGVVYLAERADEQFEQRVALKLMRRGFDEPHLVRRFFEERQILASLDHPLIARLLDGGLTNDGLPWFAMEYVEGTPIDDYADARRLSIEQRLRLFLEVCDAVQYAHRNLVVHRDLKPSNVFVTATGSVKLLDFGIAKLLAPGDRETTLTQTGQRVLTPDYASPEQVRGEPITVTSDVYSLGVVLYELLAGQRPYRAESPFEIERVILEADPTRPSQVAAREGTVAAAARSTTPDRLQRQLRGDLDTIVLKALRKEVSRRYPSVEQLASDVKRHLGGLPVSAQRDTWGYRAGKFVRRHPVGLGAVVTIMLLLAGFGLFAELQARRISQERDRAEEISRFLSDILAAPNPYAEEGGALSMREVLDSAVPRLARELADQPRVRSDLLSVVGKSYYGLGLYDQAQATLDSAVALRRRTTGEDSALVMDMVQRGHIALARGDAATAESLARRSIAISRRLFSDQYPNLTESLNLLGQLLAYSDRYAEGDSALNQSIAILRTHQDRDSGQRLAEALDALAHVRREHGDLVSAESLRSEAIDLARRALGEEHPALAMLYLTHGQVLATQNDTMGLWYLRRALEIDRRALGEHHRDVIVIKTQLAQALIRQNDLVSAESLFHSALLSLHRRSPTAADSNWTAQVMHGLGEIALKRGDLATAESHLRETLLIVDRAWPQLRPTYSLTLQLLAESLTRGGRYAAAEPVLLEALSHRMSLYGAKHKWTQETLHRVVTLYEKLGRPEKGQEFRAKLESGAAER